MLRLSKPPKSAILWENMPISRSLIEQTLATKTGERGYSIVERLETAGYEAWWVGGAVRQMVLGEVPTDIDIATNAMPEQVAGIFTRSGDASRGLGSCRVQLGDEAFEVTTFRQDHDTSNGRHPESVTFGSRNDDAARRDFTVNALYWHPMRFELWDPYQGLTDLHERLIRFIGEPGQRIKHDTLRILRAVRLRAALHGQYHPDTYAALREHAALIEQLSPERLRTELEKLLLTPHPDRGLQDLWDLQLLVRFIPELADCKGVAQPAYYHHEGDVWDHTMQCLRSLTPEHDLDVRLAILFHDCGKVQTFSIAERIRFDHHASVSADTATRVLERLQCPKERRQKIDWLIRHHMSMTFLEMPTERKAHWYYHPWFASLLQVFWLDIAGTTPSEFDLYNDIVADYHQFLDAHPAPQKPLLTGKDLIEQLGLHAGATVGQLLKIVHDAQIRQEVHTQAEALAYAKTQLQFLKTTGVSGQ